MASLATGDRRWLGALVGAVVMGAVYLLLAVLPGGGVGGGDVRLAPVIGGLLGWLGPGRVVVGLLAGFLVGGLAAVALLALRRVGLRSSIAYGPAMCLGAWVAIGFTSRILTWLTGRLRAAWKDSPHAALADRRGVARARARRDDRRAARGGRGHHGRRRRAPWPAAGWATAAAPG